MSFGQVFAFSAIKAGNVMTRNSNASDMSYMAARELAASGRYSDAIVAYSLTIDRDPGHIRARVGRGLALQRIGEHVEAIADFDNVISCYPDWPGAFVAYYSRAVSRQELGRAVEVVDDCDEAIRRKPDHTDALYLRGIARKALGNVESAISDMDAVLIADPGYQEAYLVRGGLHYLQQRWKQAIGDLTAAIEHGTAATEIARECFYLRGMAAQELGEHSAAIADFTRAIELAPNDGGAYLRRSWSYREMGNPALADADVRTGGQTYNYKSPIVPAQPKRPLGAVSRPMYHLNSTKAEANE